MISLTLRDSLNFVKPLIKNQQLDITNLQPGLTMGNNVLQRMIAPPFRYRFNRKAISIPVTAVDGTDYQIEIDDLGWIETQWLELTVDATQKFELKGEVSLAKVSMSTRPTSIAPQFDDNAGNITFRINAVPNKNYTVWLNYQVKAQLITSYAQNFGPFPDEFGFIYNKGMLAEAALAINDPRFNIWNRDFAMSLVHTQDGLDAQAKQIILEQMLGWGRTSLRSQAMGQEGAQFRGMAGA